MQHQASEGQERQPRHGLGQAFVVTRQATEARHPGESALDHPAPRQQDETTPGAVRVGQLDHLQLDALRGRRCGGFSARVALVDIRQFHGLAGHLLDQRRQRGHLRPLLVARWGDHGGQQMPQGVHRQMRALSSSSCQRACKW